MRSPAVDPTRPSRLPPHPRGPCAASPRHGRPTRSGCLDCVLERQLGQLLSDRLSGLSVGVRDGNQIAHRSSYRGQGLPTVRISNLRLCTAAFVTRMQASQSRQRDVTGHGRTRARNRGDARVAAERAQPIAQIDQAIAGSHVARIESGSVVARVTRSAPPTLPSSSRIGL